MTRAIGTRGRPAAAGSSPTWTCLPRRRSERIASAQVCSLPTASTATWLPPSVISMTISGMSRAPSEVSTWSAPSVAATASAPGWRSTATTRAPRALAIITELRPTPPAPITVSHSPAASLARPVSAR